LIPENLPPAERLTAPPSDIVAVPKIPPIARRLERLLAFLIDTAILGIAGQVLGWSLASLWFALGPYARLAGFSIAFFYVAIMGSSLGDGATFGKRVLGISVRGADGEPISLLRSSARAAILLPPTLFNGWAISLMGHWAFAAIATVLVFGVGGALLLTMIFNRSTRQGLHDLIVGSYVLKLKGQPVVALPVAGGLPWMMASVAVAGAAVLWMASGLLQQRFSTELEPLQRIQSSIQQDRRFFGGGVFDRTLRMTGRKPARTLVVQAWLKGKQDDDVKRGMRDDLVRAALKHPKIDAFDSIQIELVTAFDLFIASGRSVERHVEAVADWKAELRSGRD
jgi:uncharacterized RDD family membrane protein YckC